jgi:outer membrane protein TolC
MKILVRRIILLIAFTECYATLVAAAPLSLQNCIVQAIHHSPSLSAARHEAKALQEGVIKQQRALMPSLSAQTSAYEVNGAPATPFSALRVFDAENPHAGNAHWGPVGLESIGVQYPLIQNGSILGLNDPPEVAAARASLDKKLAWLLLAEQKVVFDTITAYSYSVWYRNEAALASKILHLSEQRLEIIEYQAELELKLPQDVELARAQVVAAQEVEEFALRNSQNSIATLSALIGRPDSDITVDTNPEPTPQLPSLREFLAHVMPVHPALRVQEGQIEIARQQVRIDKAALWPSVKLNFGVAGSQDLEHFQGNTLSNFLSFIQVDIPLFDFGKRKAAVRASQEELASAQDSLKATDLELRDSISQTYHQIFDYDEQVATAQTDVLKATNAADLAEAERHEGLIDKLAWVEAQLQVPAMKIVLGQEQLLVQLKYAELRNLSGGIWNWLEDPAPPSVPFAARKKSKIEARMAKQDGPVSAGGQSISNRSVVEPTVANESHTMRRLEPVAGRQPSMPERRASEGSDLLQARITATLSK